MVCMKCGTSNPDNASSCAKCGAPLAEEAVTAVGAALPAAASTARRVGKKFVVPRAGVALPPNCVKCGRPTREVLDKTFWWHDPVLFVLILLGVMVYVIVALIARKSCTLNVPVCEEHRRSYQSRRRIGRNLMLASIPLWAVIWIAGNGSDEAVGLGALVFLLVFVVGLIVRRAAGPIKPANIDKQTATFRGASESFLQLLPS